MFPFSSSRNVSISHWKVAGAFLNPNGMTLKCYRPAGVMKAVLALLLGSIVICTIEIDCGKYGFHDLDFAYFLVTFIYMTLYAIQIVSKQLIVNREDIELNEGSFICVVFLCCYFSCCEQFLGTRTPGRAQLE